MGTQRPHLSPGRRRFPSRSRRVSASSSEDLSTAEVEEVFEVKSSATAVDSSETAEIVESAGAVTVSSTGRMSSPDREIQDSISQRQHMLLGHLSVSKPGLGRCTIAFWLAVSFDVVGLAVLLAGVFSEVFFYDLLLYCGSILIFFSLIWWVFWYTGNIEAPPDHSLLPNKRIHFRSSSFLHSLRISLNRRRRFFSRTRRQTREPQQFTLKMVDTFQSELREPETPQPESLQPENLQSESPQPGDLQPESPQPGDLQPESPQPGDLQPESPQPEDLQPESFQPEDLQPDCTPSQNLHQKSSSF